MINPDGSPSFVWYRFLTGLWNAIGASRVAVNSAVVIQQVGSELVAVLASTGATIGNLLSGALPPGKIFVGNASGVATPVSLSGDGTLTSAGNLTISAIDGQAISLSAPFTTVGGGSIEFVASGPADLTLPLTGTLSTLANLASALPISTGELLGNSATAGATNTIALGSNLSLSGIYPSQTLNAAAGFNFLAHGLSVPSAGSFTWINQGGAAAANQTNGPLTLTFPAEASTNLHFFGVAIPASEPWTATAELAITASLNNFHYAGLAISDGTKFVGITWLGTGTVPNVYVQSWATVTSGGSTLYNTSWLFPGPAAFLRIYDDGTNNKFQVSGDGVTWTTLYSQAKGATLTATRVGLFGMAIDTSDGQVVSNCWGWEAVTGTGTVLGWT